MKALFHIPILVLTILFLQACGVSATFYDSNPTITVEFTSSEILYDDLKVEFEEFSEKRKGKYKITPRDNVFKRPNSFYYLARNKNVLIHSSVGLNDSFIVSIHNSKIQSRRPSEEETIALGQEITKYLTKIDGVSLIEMVSSKTLQSKSH